MTSLQATLLVDDSGFDERLSESFSDTVNDSGAELLDVLGLG